MRKPIVAGTFYPQDKKTLLLQVEDCLHQASAQEVDREKRILGMVSPHAGYVYSGGVAGHGFFALSQVVKKPQVVIIIGPNHRGGGEVVAISRQDRWETPLGELKVDLDLGEEIASKSRFARFDDRAHMMEHSLEVQLPFLQCVLPGGVDILPIVMLYQELEVSQDLGKAIASSLSGKQGLILASSDFTHYEPQAVAKAKDEKALEAILALDPQKLSEVVSKGDMTMCGPGPVMAMLYAAKELGATQARNLCYRTSGDVTGDFSQVVGYASVIVS
jgi:hypothetical protein